VLNKNGTYQLHPEQTVNVPTLLITRQQDRLGGKPVFAGTRVPINTLFEHLAAGDALEVFLIDFPSVSREHAQAVLALAHEELVQHIAAQPVAAE
jgi:uncharacterized protein (DUF433 family)